MIRPFFLAAQIAAINRPRRRGRSKPASHGGGSINLRILARWPMPTDDKQQARSKRRRDRKAARGYALARDLAEHAAATRGTP